MAKILEVKIAKILGITMDNDQKWTSHFWGKKGLLKSLNQRPYAIRKISNLIPKNKLNHVMNSIWMSKLRYGFQQINKVKLMEEGRKTKKIKAKQIAQNKALRLPYGSRVKDRRKIKEILNRFDILSVNQNTAQIKLQEA